MWKIKGSCAGLKNHFGSFGEIFLTLTNSKSRKSHDIDMRFSLRTN